MLPLSDAARFKMSTAVVWLFGVVAALGLGVTLLCVGWLATSWGTLKAQDIWTGLLSILMFGGAAAYCWDAMRRALVQIAVDETGIWQLPRKGTPVFIAWRDVSIVRADDTMQRLIVSDHTHTFWLEYQLDDFSSLREYVLKHTKPESRADPSGNSVFHRTWINKGVFIILSLPMLVFSTVLLLNGQLGGVLILGFAILLLCFITQDPLGLTIESKRVVIRYPGWKRIISFSDITSATLRYESTAKGDVWAVVVIRLKNQRPLKLYRFREGSLALIQALQSALGPTVAPETTS